MTRLRDVASGVVVNVDPDKAAGMLGRRWELVDSTVPTDVGPESPEPKPVKVKPAKAPTK